MYRRNQQNIAKQLSSNLKNTKKPFYYKNKTQNWFDLYSHRSPSWLKWSRISLHCRRPRFYLWVGKMPWRREWVPTPVFLPGEFYGQRSLVGYSPWGCKQSDSTEQLTFSFFSLSRRCTSAISCLIISQV